MDFDLIGFGEKLKEIRLENGLRQKDVTELIGINRDTLRKLENGQSLPKIDTMEQLGYVYKRDIYKLFSNYRINIDNYVTTIMKEVLQHFRTYDYEQIIKICDDFYETFESSQYYSNVYIQKKMKQFKTYLLAVANIESSFTDKGRESLTELFVTLGYTQMELKYKMVRLDKLEIRIILLLATIYRYRDELINTNELMETVLHEITHYYKEDEEFLYFYTVTVMNLMTYYHRQDEYEKLDALYKTSLNIYDKALSLHNFSYLLIRVGINKHYLEDIYSNDFVNTGLALLKDHVYQSKYDKHKATLGKMYDFLDLKLEKAPEA